MYLGYTVAGVKIDRLNLLDSRGFDRSRISSRAIEAYLIQVQNPKPVLKSRS